MASDNELLIRLGVDTSNANKQLKAIQTELKELNKQINLVDDSTEDFNKSATGLTKQLELQKKASQTYTTQLKVQKDQLHEYRTALKQTEDSLEELREKHGENSKEVKNAEKMIVSYKQKIGQLETSIETTTTQMEAMNRSINETSKKLNGLKWYNLADGLKTISNGFENVSNATGKMADLIMPLSTTIAGGFAFSAKTAMDFETAMTQVGVTSQATAEEMEQLKEVAIQLGEELPISSTDAAEGLNYLALAGYDVAQQLIAIEPIAKASVAWASDLATVSDLATDSLSAMNLGVEDLAGYMDMLSNAQSNSNTTAVALMEAYIEVGGSLAQLNVPLEESMTLLGTMANRGIKGAEAGRALSAVLINLTAGTAKSVGALEELNIQTFDAQGNFVGLENILLQLNEALAGLTEEQKNNYLAAIGGKQHVSDLNAILAGLNEEYGDLKLTISDSTGVLDEMTDKMGSTTAMTIEELKGKLESLAIKIGDKLLPFIEKAAEYLMVWIDKFNALDEETQNTILKIGALIAIGAPLLKVFSNITGGVGDFFDSMSNLSRLIGDKGGIRGSLISLSDDFGKLNLGMKEIDSSIGTTLLSGLGKAGSGMGVFSTAVGVATAALVGGGAAYGLYKAFQNVLEVSQWSSEGTLRNSEYLRLIKEPAGEAEQALIDLAAQFQMLYETSSTILQTMANTNTAISQAQYQAIVSSYEQTHNDVISSLETRRQAEYDIIDAMYEEKLNTAALMGEEEVRIVEGQKQAEIDAVDKKINEMIDVENRGYEQILQNAEWALEERYAQNESFQEKQQQDLKNYYDNVSLLTETGEYYQAEIIRENQKEMIELRRQFEEDYSSGATDMYDKILQTARDNRDQERTIEDENYAEKLEKFGAYSDSWFEAQNTTKKEFIEGLKAQHEEELGLIEGRYQDEVDALNQAAERRAEAMNLQAMAEQEILQQGYTLSETELTNYLARVDELYKAGYTDHGAIIDTALKDILGIETANYIEQENALNTHNENMETATQTTVQNMYDTTHQGLGGMITTIEEADFGTPMTYNVGEMETVLGQADFTTSIETGLQTAVNTIESTDFQTPTATALAGVENAANTVMPQIPIITATGIEGTVNLLNGADLATPATTMFNGVDDAADTSMSNANETTSGWLETIAGAISSWDLLTPTLSAGGLVVNAMETTMTDTNTSAETGIETVNTTIENAPFEETMITQGEKMNNAMETSMTTINTTTDNGMTTIDTTIDNAPLEATMESQGSRMNSAQANNMSELAGTTTSGMSNVRSALESAWNGIVSWWNAQSLKNKDVNINVRTNYLTTGTPTQYSNGSRIAPMSLRSDEGFMGSIFPSDMEIPEYGLVSNPYTLRGVTTSVGKLDLPDLNYLSRRGESTPTYDLSSLDKKLDTLIEVLSNKENGNTTFTIEEMNVRTDQDIRNIARELDALRKIQARGRGES